MHVAGCLFCAGFWVLGFGDCSIPLHLHLLLCQVLFEEVLNHLRGNPPLTPALMSEGESALDSASVADLANVQDIFAHSGYQHMSLRYRGL